MSRILTILYEDQIGVALKEFGVHNLLLRCVCDDLDGADHWELGKRIQGQPKKGDSGIIRALEADGRRLLDSGHLVALFDDDKIRRRLKIPSGSCRKIVADDLRNKAPGCDVVLLLDNTETLLDACMRTMGGMGCPEKPDPAARDRIFNRFANDSNPEQRKQLRGDVPSFDRLVGRVADWYRTH